MMPFVLHRGIMNHDAQQEVEMTDAKGFTVRLSAEQAEEIEAVAAADGVSVAEEIRQAVAARIDERRKDKAFQKRLREIIDQNRRVLERLAE